MHLLEVPKGHVRVAVVGEDGLLIQRPLPYQTPCQRGYPAIDDYQQG